LVHLVSQTWDRLAGRSHYSLFNYYRPQAAIDLGRVDPQALKGLLGSGWWAWYWAPPSSAGATSRL
jgi:hypothetical protein